MTRHNRTDSFETQSICSMMDKLSLEKKAMKRSKKCHLQMLDDELEQFKRMNGISNTKLAKVINEKGICLVNCIHYGNALRKTLVNNKHLRINREEAKKYKNVKKCLIILY